MGPKSPKGTKAPVELMVLNMRFEVRWVDRLVEDASDNFGWFQARDQIICISDSLKPNKTADTFLHELIHAINWIFDISDDTKEESIATRLSSGLACVWRQNPKAFQWLQEMILG